MRTVVLGPMPEELATLIDRRRATGADRYDEVWEGDYHMAPAHGPAHGLLDNELTMLLTPLARRAGLYVTSAFNLGDHSDYRVPDRGFHREKPTGTWAVDTAAMVVEVVSPDDETWDKLGFYAAHDVEEILIADPADRSVTLLALQGGSYKPAERSRLLDVTAAENIDQIDWPPYGG